MKRLRPLGKITGDMELLLEEMVDCHDLQTGEILALVYSWLQVHRPGAFEEYTDGSGRPEFRYGPKENLK